MALCRRGHDPRFVLVDGHSLIAHLLVGPEPVQAVYDHTVDTDQGWKT